MSDIVDIVKDLVYTECENYKRNSDDSYDFWNEHIKLVYKNAIMLAERYSADIEIVKLGALLHDIALVKKVGTRQHHHETGAKIATEILKSHNYFNDNIERVAKTVLNHRSSKNSSCVEDICVSDADILAHFDNIPMIFNCSLVMNKIGLNDIREKLKISFEEDYNDLSDSTKKMFNERYKLICSIVLGEEK